MKEIYITAESKLKEPEKIYTDLKEWASQFNKKLAPFAFNDYNIKTKEIDDAHTDLYNLLRYLESLENFETEKEILNFETVENKILEIRNFLIDLDQYIHADDDDDDDDNDE